MRRFLPTGSRRLDVLPEPERVLGKGMVHDLRLTFVEDGFELYLFYVLSHCAPKCESLQGQGRALTVCSKEADHFSAPSINC